MVCAPQQRLDAGGQLADAHRLDHEIVGTGGKALDHVAFGAAVGDEEHRHPLGQVPAHPLQDFETADIGQLPIENQQVETFPSQGSKQGLAFGEAMAIVTHRRKRLLDQFQLVRIVI